MLLLHTHILHEQLLAQFCQYFSGDSGPRSVLSFTLRDSPFDYVNVSLWGKPSSVGETAASFSVGDIGK